MASLVYGLSNAATSPNGVSHWGDAKVVASLAASAVLLAAFAIIELRSRHALLPAGLLRSRDRVGAILVMLCVGTSAIGMYFFLTLFMQLIWGYSALRTGVAYLPYTAAVVVVSGTAAQLVPKVGARALLAAGSLVSAGGLYWLSQMTDHGTYVGAVLGPMLVSGAGLGLLFVPLTLVALSGVRAEESGVASSLLNAGQQVGGSIGLAVLGTVAWTVVANSARAQAAHAAGSGHAAVTAIYHHALAAGFARAFLAGAAVMLIAVAVVVTAIRARRADVAGAQDPAPNEPAITVASASAPSGC